MKMIGRTPSTSTFCFYYAIIPASFILFVFTWPKKLSTDALSESNKSEDIPVEDTAEAKRLMWISLKEDIVSMKFGLYVVWACLDMLVLNHYLGKHSDHC